ncbi:uncharacterized protein BDZ99DRAFT_524491 [Mytilinidion resinicola]|uniref:NAD(P)-binding protein n=1 Tax=Mytilinidion resinicola TaxID=574789 RepID=A0A6A6Y9M2_9PEZI|nr:uncharacterized protein BDZ99DRAFT_524491 [Mytilinidion resinicola]KAF2805522.1 hypothetical protein BDZ99DRAFT_524491 [Mytilinidion resinicola]
MATAFDISPEQRATQLHYFYANFSSLSRSGGLGLETARQLLDLGCKVILALRDEGEGEKGRKDLANGRDLPSGSIQVWKLDHSSYDSIVTFAERAKHLDHLDITILNAGVFKGSESFSSTGYEEGTMGDLYGTTKLLGQLFLTELSKYVSPSAVTLSCANPGFCRGSDLARETHGIVRFIYRIQSYLLSQTCAVGARTLVHAVTTLSEQAHGQYIEEAKIQLMAPIVHRPEGLHLAKQLYDETLDELSFAGARNIVAEITKSR